ncbi:MAG: hypothetical protein GY869_05480 [Planctomycetes bacterium]|nr:hypothetical protein [Planctomycetota bacterium]
MTHSKIGAYDTSVKSAETPGETDAAVLEKAARFLHGLSNLKYGNWNLM